METITLPNDINVFYVRAKSFPAGIAESYEKLHSIVPMSSERKYFGLSRPEDGVIQYKAAAEELNEGEAEKFNCEKLVVKKGKYKSITIKDYTKNISSIGEAFQKILALPGLDPEGYCVEWYLNDKEVICMVRLDQ